MTKEIFTSRYNYTYNDYLDYCNDMGVTPSKEDSIDFYNWINMMQEMDVEDFLTNLRYAEDLDVPCMILGSVGAWNGRHEIYPLCCSSYITAFNKCIGSCDDFDVYLDENCVTIHAHHHDGTNIFDIWMLSSKGKFKANAGETYEECPRSWIKKLNKKYLF